MAINVLKSKLSIPKPLNRAIERRRLVDIVEKANRANLILLVAPAGYGKTTLAQQVLTARPNSVKTWYHLDASDANTDQFLKYLVSALQSMLPQFDIASPGSDIRQVTDDICFAIEQYSGRPVCLVLDNWECVDQNADIASMPAVLARSGRDRLTIIIASRVPPSFKVRREQARGNILILDTSQMAFSLAECQEAMKLTLGRDVKDEVVERFWKETSGWCVSVGLLPRGVASIEAAAAGRGRLALGGIDAFQDYFREELYDTLPPDLARFLCEASMFDVLTAERCAAIVSEPDRVEEFLTSLSKSAIPHVALEQKGHYRLHALARQAFRLQLEKIAPPEQVTALSRAAANRYLEEGLVYEVIEVLMELGDYETALEMMDTKWTDLYGQYGWTRVRQWLESIPAEYHEHAVYIKTFSNVLNVSGDNRGSIAFLKDKLLPERFSDDIESFGSLWANYWWAQINTEPGPHYDSVLKDHRKLTEADLGFSSTMLGIFQNTLGMAAHLELRLREAIQHVRKAAELVEEPYIRLRIIANQNEALYCHLQGDSLTALSLLKEARSDCHRLGLQSQLPKFYMLEASIHLAMGYYRETLDDIDLCFSSMREFSDYSLQVDAYVGRFRGLALWYLGDRNEGLRLLKESQEPAGEFGALTGLEVRLLYEYYSLLGDHRMPSSSKRDIIGLNQPSECRLTYLALESLRAIKGADRAGFKRHATQILDLARSHELNPWIATGSFLLAKSLGQAKDRQIQIDLLRKGLETLKQIGWRSYPMAFDGLTAFVVAQAIRHGIDFEMVGPLISSSNDIDLTPAFDAELRDKSLKEEERIRIWKSAARLSVRGLSGHLKPLAVKPGAKELAAHKAYWKFLEDGSLPPLRIEMLGGFSVSSKGRIVHFTRSSARLLLQHLLVAYPRRMHEEELMEYLWPESDPSKGRANLRTSIKDLRKGLDPYAVPRGPSYVVYVDQQYGLELPDESQVDYLIFIDLIEGCFRSEASTAISVDDHIASLKAALESYRGPVLPMLPYESFTVELREELHSLYQRGSLKLAEILIESGAIEEAAAIIERALAYDPLWTDGVRVLLQTYAMRGDVLKAMRAYRGYEKRLRDELALSPEESIRAYFDEILKSSN